MDFRTSYSRVTGLGSAKQGTRHFWRQRVTAVANVPLVLVFGFVILTNLGASRTEMLALFANPFVAALTILMLLSAIFHMWLGLQVIVEDYVQAEVVKLVLLVFNGFFAVSVGAVGLVAVLKLMTGG
ncbi:MAG: succinate dehydrogenase, hydrophobic membrane anchor protein [Alphaproteobacteria bacterium]|nr:succinate dehydrogenase, hydrophobic membrane anchor protein [Alphaproteobacteria bacterium]